MQLTGKIILITGGASGIGLEAVKQFLSNGAKVIITGRNQQKLEAAKRMYPTITAIQSDAANEEDARALFERIGAMGGIDILYNNAGVSSKLKNLGVSDDAHFATAQYEMSINYLAVIHMNNMFMNMLQSREQAAIINTSSILSYIPSNQLPTYGASKAAVRLYTEALRNHLRIMGSHVKVFELSPPLVATDMAEGIDAKAMSPEILVNKLIVGLKNDRYTICVGNSKVIYFLSRFVPHLADKLLNTSKIEALLRG